MSKDKGRILLIGANAKALTLLLLLGFLGSCGSADKRPLAPFEGASVADEHNLWVTTSESELLHVRDGRLITSQFAGNAAAIDFVSPTIGRLLMKSGVVAETRDGGTTWHEVGKVGARWPFATNDLMEFVDYQIGWISSHGFLFRTADGGRSWTSFDLTPYGPASDFKAPNADELWGISWTGEIFHTMNSGNTWRLVDAPGLKSNASYPRTIETDPKGRVWVGNVSPDPVFYVSNNRGNDWEVRRFPAEDGTIRVTSMEFDLDGNGYAVFRRVVDTNQPIKSYLVRSFDSGDTWTSVDLGGMQFDPVSIKSVDKSVVFLLEKSRIASTNDGGNSWNLYYSLPGRISRL